MNVKASGVAGLLSAMLVMTAAVMAMPGINDKKTGPNSNSVTMQVFGSEADPMSATVVQHGDDVILTIVQGVKTNAKPVQVDRGTCARLGSAHYELPPFTGGQYVATLKHAALTSLEDDDHAIVILGAHRSPFACGDLVKPNFLRH